MVSIATCTTTHLATCTLYYRVGQRTRGAISVLQPQENIWLLMKARVERPAPQNLLHLQQLLQEEWNQQSVDDIDPVWESVSHRIECVIDAGRSWSKY